MELNKVIKLSSRKRFEVSGIIRTRRILYFKEENKIIIKCSAAAAIEELEKSLYTKAAEILSPSQAARRFPEVFKNSSKRDLQDGKDRMIILRVPSEMYRFCCRHGQITAYLQSLIKKEMDSSL